MLVLTRRVDESIIIGDNVEIRVLSVRGSGDQAVIRIGISAPKDVTVLRKEVFDEVVVANQQAVHPDTALPAELLEAAQTKADSANVKRPTKKL